jgi:hypothetical protein
MCCQGAEGNCACRRSIEEEMDQLKKEAELSDLKVIQLHEDIVELRKRSNFLARRAARIKKRLKRHY